MSTHNIGFYEDLTKIIFELSSNIISSAAYIFYIVGFYHCELRHKKTCLRGFRPGPTQTWLYSHRNLKSRWIVLSM